MAPCIDAVVKNVITLKPDSTVHEAMDIFRKEDIRSLPVLNDDGKFLGIFGLRHILRTLLPKYVTMQDGLENLDFLQGGAPGIAKRLNRLYSEPVSEAMDTEAISLSSDTSTWEALRVMALQGSPIAIVDEETRKFEGLISRQSLLEELDNLIEEINNAGDEG